MFFLELIPYFCTERNGRTEVKEHELGQGTIYSYPSLSLLASIKLQSILLWKITLYQQFPYFDIYTNRIHRLFGLGLGQVIATKQLSSYTAKTYTGCKKYTWNPASDSEKIRARKTKKHVNPRHRTRRANTCKLQNGPKLGWQEYRRMRSGHIARIRALFHQRATKGQGPCTLGHMKIEHLLWMEASIKLDEWMCVGFTREHIYRGGIINPNKPSYTAHRAWPLHRKWILWQ